MNKLIKIMLCHECGTSFDREMFNRNCGNCFACTGCEIYICPGCSTEIIIKPRKEQN